MAVNMNEKSKVRNLCDYPVSWVRSTIQGDEYFKANGSCYILNSELDAQRVNGNKFLIGTDGFGGHALVYIESDELREYFEFDNKEEKRKQLIVDDAKCEYILGLKTPASFKKNLEDMIVTDQEKIKIMNVARKMKLNELDKVQTLESYTGIKFKSE